MPPDAGIEKYSDPIFRLGFRNEAEYAAARSAFVDAGFGEAAFVATVGSARISVAGLASGLPQFLRKTAAGRPLDTLVRLFFLETDVDRDAAAAALAPLPLEAWAAAGLVAERDGRVSALVRLVTASGFFLASDRLADIRAGGRSDFVTGAGGSSQLLANVAIRRPCRLTLDLGAGCGVLALIAASFSERVIATDKNPRALEFVKLNAGLNGIGNVECRAGDLFEPVAGQRFDRILCNPPYVISPGGRYVFRDSGFRGDEFCRRILREGMSRLEPSGFLQIVCNWPHAPGGRDAAWLEESLAGTSSDAIAWIGARQDASSYAATWIDDTETPGDLDRSRELYDRWTSYLEREGIEAVSYGVVTVRRSSGEGWVHVDDAPEEFRGPSGEAFPRGFALQEFLRSTSDERLLDERFRLAPEVRLEQRCRPNDGGWTIDETTLSLARGPAWSMRIDSAISTLILRSNGERTLRELFREVATSLGVDVDRAVPGGLVVVRQLLQRGFLLPPGMEDE